jgi:hypothetical protein
MFTEKYVMGGESFLVTYCAFWPKEEVGGGGSSLIHQELLTFVEGGRTILRPNNLAAQNFVAREHL